MPWVDVHYSTAPEDLRVVREHLRPAVAYWLGCTDPGGELREEDIEIFFHDPHPLTTSAYDIAIKLQAMAFPARSANRTDRITEIGRQIRTLLPSRLKICIWAQIGGDFVWWASDQDSEDHTRPSNSTLVPDREFPERLS